MAVLYLTKHRTIDKICDQQDFACVRFSIPSRAQKGQGLDIKCQYIVPHSTAIFNNELVIKRPDIIPTRA